MWSPKVKPRFLELPNQRPHILREYTASPPDLHTCTPRTSHGFIPLDTSIPQPTAGGHHAGSTDFGYFSLPKVKSVLSPEPNPYEQHGFIPLCSVAVVEEKDEAKDYFSHALVEVAEELDQELQPAAAIEESPASHTATHQAFGSDTEELMHPTGSPVHERVFTVSIRGGHEHTELYDRSEPYPIEDVLDKLEQNGHYFNHCVASLERVSFESDTTKERIVTHNDRLELSLSPPSCESARSASIYSAHFDEGLADEEPHFESGKEDADWDDFARHTPLPDSNSSDAADYETANEHDTEYGTALSEQKSDSDYHTALLHPPESDMNSEKSGLHAEQIMLATTMQTTLEGQNPNNPSSFHRDMPMSESMSPGGSSPPRRHKLPSPPPKLTVYQYALRISPKTLASLLVGPNIDIVNSTTKEICAPHVPILMLLYFCGPELLNRFSTTSTTSSSQRVLEIPASSAEKEGIARILHSMMRCCKPESHTSSSDMRIPQGATYLKDGIESVRACRVLNLHADAERTSRHIISNLQFTDDTIDTIWNAYAGNMRSSAFGDAVAWYILKSTQSEHHGLKEKLLGMLEQEEFAELKQCVREEVKLRVWRMETREEYLDRCAKERRRKEKKRVRLEDEEREMVESIEGSERAVCSRGRGGGRREWSTGAMRRMG